MLQPHKVFPLQAIQQATQPAMEWPDSSHLRALWAPQRRLLRQSMLHQSLDNHWMQPQ